MTQELPLEEKRHRFLDETGDATFYGKGRKLIVGEQGVSLTFGMGIVRIDAALDHVRQQVKALEKQVETDPLLKHNPKCSEARPIRRILFPRL